MPVSAFCESVNRSGRDFAAAAKGKSKGRVVSVIGAVVDVQFDNGVLVLAVFDAG